MLFIDPEKKDELQELYPRSSLYNWTKRDVIILTQKCKGVCGRKGCALLRISQKPSSYTHPSSGVITIWLCVILRWWSRGICRGWSKPGVNHDHPLSIGFPASSTKKFCHFWEKFCQFKQKLMPKYPIGLSIFKVKFSKGNIIVKNLLLQLSVKLC